MGESTIQRAVMRRSELLRYLDISKSTLWRWIHELGFPRPILSGPGCVSRWVVTEVDAWLLARANERGENFVTERRPENPSRRVPENVGGEMGGGKILVFQPSETIG